MKTIKCVAMALAGLLMVACDQEKPEDYGFYGLAAGPGQEVIINYAANTLLSIQLADIAVKNAESEEVREFAAQLAEDHRRIYGELEKLAVATNMKLPKRFVQKQVDLIQVMRSKKGADFDDEYIDIVGGYQHAFKSKMEDMFGQASQEEVLNFAKLVDAQRLIHQDRLKNLKSEASA